MIFIHKIKAVGGWFGMNEQKSIYPIIFSITQRRGKMRQTLILADLVSEDKGKVGRIARIILEELDIGEVSA